MHAFWLVLTYDLLEDRRIDDVIIKTFLILYYIKQIDSKLPCVCSLKDHRGRQNVVRTEKWHTRRSRVCHWWKCFRNSFTVWIRYWKNWWHKKADLITCRKKPILSCGYKTRTRMPVSILYWTEKLCRKGIKECQLTYATNEAVFLTLLEIKLQKYRSWTYCNL